MSCDNASSSSSERADSWPRTPPCSYSYGPYAAFPQHSTGVDVFTEPLYFEQAIWPTNVEMNYESSYTMANASTSRSGRSNDSDGKRSAYSHSQAYGSPDLHPSFARYGAISYENYHENGYFASHTSLPAILQDSPGPANSAPYRSQHRAGSFHHNTALASSYPTSASLVSDALDSGTLHQYACAKQRRSRHDPGGGTSQQGPSETPVIQTYHEMIPHHFSQPLPIASPNSSALYNAIVEVPPLVRSQPKQPVMGARESAESRRTITHQRQLSPMAHLPYPDMMQAEASSSTSSTSINPTSGLFTSTPLESARRRSYSRNRTDSPDGIRFGRNRVAPYPMPQPEESSQDQPLEKQKYKRGTPTKIACFFCRKRKIACGGPPDGNKDGACKQCVRRDLECYYPEATHRGRRSPFASGAPDLFAMNLSYPESES